VGGALRGKGYLKSASASDPMSLKFGVKAAQSFLLVYCGLTSDGVLGFCFCFCGPYWRAETRS